MSRYRYPVGAGLLLWVGSLLWAWSAYGDAAHEHQRRLGRHADSLAEALRVAAADTDDAGLRAAVHAHLQVRRPLTFAVIRRGERIIAQVGGEDAAAWRPGNHPAAALEVVRIQLDHPQPALDPDEPGPPWVWRGVGSTAGALYLDVGLDTRFAGPPQARAERRIMTITAVVWLAIAALIWAWIRSISARDLLTALDAERRERAILGEMNLAAAGLAHETKNPIGIIFGLAQRLAADSALAAPHQESAEQIMDAADRATARLGEFINFAHRPSPQINAVPLDELLTRTIAILGPDFAASGVGLKRTGPSVVVRCDPAMVEQLLVNLLLNSLHASPAGRTTTIRVEAAGRTVTLSVVDEGEGIPEALRADIFKPYVSGREGGHGMGLAIVKRIVEQHGWTLGVQSAPGQGTTVSIAGLDRVEGEAA